MGEQLMWSLLPHISFLLEELKTVAEHKNRIM